MSETTVMVSRWLKELPRPDTESGRLARAELIEHSRRRMQAICRKMFYPSLRGSPIDQEDVYQETALRLWRALAEVQPATPSEFFGLAAALTRRVLIDMCRKYLHDPPERSVAQVDDAFNPYQLAKWTEFHLEVNRLEPSLRSVVELIWYHDLTQKESAEVLGVDERTVRRRWRKARERLAEHIL